MSRQTLPIDAVLARIKRSLRETPSLVLRAPPGAGKTTRVPVALLGFLDAWRVAQADGLFESTEVCEVSA